MGIIAIIWSAESPRLTTPNISRLSAMLRALSHCHTPKVDAFPEPSQCQVTGVLHVSNVWKVLILDNVNMSKLFLQCLVVVSR